MGMAVRFAKVTYPSGKVVLATYSYEKDEIVLDFGNSHSNGRIKSKEGKFSEVEVELDCSVYLVVNSATRTIQKPFLDLESAEKHARHIATKTPCVLHTVIKSVAVSEFAVTKSITYSENSRRMYETKN